MFSISCLAAEGLRADKICSRGAPAVVSASHGVLCTGDSTRPGGPNPESLNLTLQR